jgi:hypothetical protein
LWTWQNKVIFDEDFWHPIDHIHVIQWRRISMDARIIILLEGSGGSIPYSLVGIVPMKAGLSLIVMELIMNMWGMHA